MCPHHSDLAWTFWNYVVALYHINYRFVAMTAHVMVISPSLDGLELGNNDICSVTDVL